MTKKNKPHSQRRKKKGGVGAGIGDNYDNDLDLLELDGMSIDMGGGGVVDMLSDSFTIADSMSVHSCSHPPLFSTQAWDNHSEEFASNGMMDDSDEWRSNGNNDVVHSSLSLDEMRLQRVHACLSGLEMDFSSSNTSTGGGGGKRSHHNKTSKRQRERALRTVFQILTQHALGPVALHLLDEKCEAIYKACCHIGLRNGDPAEQYASCRVLEATSLLLGGVSGGSSSSSSSSGYSYDHDHHYHSSSCDEHASSWTSRLDTPLRRVVLMTTRAIPVRISSLRALSMAVFIDHARHTDTTACGTTTRTESFVSLMHLCEQLAQSDYRGERVASTLRACALDCWTLLASTLSNVDVAGYCNQDHDHDDPEDLDSEDQDVLNQIGPCGLHLLPLLKECLDDASSSSVELRSAAGECVSFIHEARVALGMCMQQEDDTTTAAIAAAANRMRRRENVTVRRYCKGSWDGSPYEVLMDEVKQRIAELAVESGKHMSKRAKKEQRATFREFMATIVDDENPEETVAFRNGSLTLHTWREIIQLNFVRHCLQSGFQAQLLSHPTLQIIFGVNGRVLGDNTTSPMSSIEKRLILSKTSDAAKREHIDMNRQRRKRENVKNHFLTADGEDI